jgi:hypothetical protein
VLFVDDEEAAITALKKILTRLGYIEPLEQRRMRLNIKEKPQGLISLSQT